MLAVVESSAILGVDAYLVRVEVNLANTTIPQFSIVGLPFPPCETFLNARHRFLGENHLTNTSHSLSVNRMTINLAPADTKKAGASFDLPIAVGILTATGQISDEALTNTLFIGELSLDGSIRPVHGVLPMAVWARQNGRRRLIVPAENTREAAIVGDVDVYPVHNLLDVITLLAAPDAVAPVREDPALALQQETDDSLDFLDVKGQAHVKRAMEVAAAGGHNVLMLGSPGSGKTMMARRLPGILPSFSVEEALEVTKLYSVSGRLPGGEALITKRPFRSPHHTISNAGLTGGGTIPRPGEVSLAHHGVLFLDELPEFNRNVLEILRQPLEDGQVTIARAAAALTYPAQFMLVAAMNPCPCGFHGDPVKPCTCANAAVQKYLHKISGPLLDRIDLHIEVPRLRPDELTTPPAGEKSAAIRQRVEKARAIQRVRFAGQGVFCNAQMTPRLLRECAPVDGEALTLLRAAIDTMNLSARAYDRILKVSRTIADLAAEPKIGIAHVAEAVQYRALDRKFWA